MLLLSVYAGLGRDEILLQARQKDFDDAGARFRFVSSWKRRFGEVVVYESGRCVCV